MEGPGSTAGVGGAGDAGGPNVRIISWNVNGLRPALKRLGVTIAQFLDGLGADIVCLQETKLQRGDVKRELAVVDGWDAFFCCDTTHDAGYSGTATFVRTATALPFAAEEGFTGCAALARSNSNGNGGGAAAAAAAAAPGPHPALRDHFEPEELAELDGEGRVLVTDHGAFVLFNLYGPAITNAETADARSGFKRRFYQALELRWRDLLRQGRAVVAVGDFNISPSPIDYRDSKPRDFFESSSCKLWLHRLLAGGASSRTQLTAGPPAAEAQAAAALSKALAEAAPWRGCGGGGFTDAFRAFHPGRANAYTCWSTATNARVNNWGSRIDLVLTAGLSVGQPPAPPPAPAATGASQAAGGGSSSGAPAVWVAGADIWPEQQGSDHCPVWAEFACAQPGAAFPCATTAPPAAMRHVYGGTQLKMHAFLQPGAPKAQAPNGDCSPPPLGLAAEPGPAAPSGAPPSQQQQRRQQSQSPRGSPRGSPGRQAGAARRSLPKGKPAAQAGGKKQQSLKHFFPQPAAQPSQQASQGDSQPGGLQQPPPAQQQQQQQQGGGGGGLYAAELAAAAAQQQVSNAEFNRIWAGLQQQAPCCRHGPAVRLKSNTKENKGRWFWTCGRPAGDKCEGFFYWVKYKKGDPLHLTLPSNRHLFVADESGGGGGGKGKGGPDSVGGSGSSKKPGGGGGAGPGTAGGGSGGNKRGSGGKGGPGSVGGSGSSKKQNRG